MRETLAVGSRLRVAADPALAFVPPRVSVAPEPRVAPLPKASVPSEMVVAPAKVLFCVRVSVPLPTLTMLPVVALPPVTKLEITPVTVVLPVPPNWKVLAADPVESPIGPERTRAEGPDILLVRVPVVVPNPAKVPLSVMLFEPLMVELPGSDQSLAMALAPLKSVLAWSVPPLRDSAPVPKAALFPAIAVPLVSVVAPV